MIAPYLLFSIPVTIFKNLFHSIPSVILAQNSNILACLVYIYYLLIQKTLHTFDRSSSSSL